MIAVSVGLQLQDYLMGSPQPLTVSTLHDNTTNKMNKMDNNKAVCIKVNKTDKSDNKSVTLLAVPSYKLSPLHVPKTVIVLMATHPAEQQQPPRQQQQQPPLSSSSPTQKSVLSQMS
jgi:hypothetical protein